jgi:serine/threonine protein kinase
LALEYIEGDTLKTLIDCKGKLSVLEALPYLYQAALGLDHAAAKGVVHRDIKPSNLLVTRQGKLKLVDLGLARSLDAPAEEALTRYGATLGTFDYLSPEQALDPRKADSRSDIYSLGCTFYHMLTGKSPVPDGTAAVKLAFHQQSKPVDPRRFCPEIPQSVVGLFEKMVEKKPENRFATPAELISAVETVAQDLKVRLKDFLSPDFKRKNSFNGPDWNSFACIGYFIVVAIRLSPKGNRSRFTIKQIPWFAEKYRWIWRSVANNWPTSPTRTSGPFR